MVSDGDGGRACLTLSESRKLMKVVQRMPEERVLLRLFMNGLTPQDAAVIRFKDFNFQTGRLDFSRPGAMRRRRRVRVDVPTLHLTHGLFQVAGEVEDRRVFTRWQEKNMTGVVKKNAELAGIPNVTPTTLRNTWVRWAISEGWRATMIHRQLGLKSLTGTEAIIAAVRRSEQEPSVMVYIPISESKKPIFEDTLKSVTALDYENYHITIGVDTNSSDDFVHWLREIAAKYNAVVRHLGDINADENITIDGKTYKATIEEGKVFSYARKARNKGLEMFRESGHDYICFVDADSLIPAHAMKESLRHFDGRHTLADRDLPVGIVGGIYFIRNSEREAPDGKMMYTPAIAYSDQFRDNYIECLEYFYQHYRDLDSIEVDAVGTGWFVVRREVAEAIDFRLPDDLRQFVGEDYYYCFQARWKGYKTVCACKIRIDHNLEEEEEFAEKRRMATVPRNPDQPEPMPGKAGPGDPVEPELHPEFTQKYFDIDYFEAGQTTGKSGYEGYEHIDLHRATARELFHFFNLKGKKTLDAGCAKGYVVGDLRAYSVDAHGVDISEYAVNAAAVILQDYLTVGTLTDLPYADREFYLVYTVDTMEHLNRWQYRQALREMARVCSKTLLLSIDTTGSAESDPSHISIMPIDKWCVIIEEEIGDKFQQVPRPRFDESVLPLVPEHCVVFVRK